MGGILPTLQDLPCHGVGEETEELSQGDLVHTVHHTHLTYQEIQDTAPGGN